MSTTNLQRGPQESPEVARAAETFMNSIDFKLRFRGKQLAAEHLGALNHLDDDGKRKLMRNVAQFVEGDKVRSDDEFNIKNRLEPPFGALFWDATLDVSGTLGDYKPEFLSTIRVNPVEVVDGIAARMMVRLDDAESLGQTPV